MNTCKIQWQKFIGKNLHYGWSTYKYAIPFKFYLMIYIDQIWNSTMGFAQKTSTKMYRVRRQQLLITLANESVYIHISVIALFIPMKNTLLAIKPQCIILFHFQRYMLWWIDSYLTFIMCVWFYLFIQGLQKPYTSNLKTSHQTICNKRYPNI